ncbi:MAG: hypothetical protein H7Y09_04270 [Chitinophagaceae bacterium]|nr:hypothetical protein [Anaerolineae bacterium]
MSQLKQLEAIAQELINLYEITAPPIPVETMLQRPIDNMWQAVDLNQMSGSFLSVRDLYSPRMSIARLLARHVVGSSWGQARNVSQLLNNDEDMLRVFTRMLVMPTEMMEALSSGARHNIAISMLFEVPEEDARLRLQEWNEA